MRYKMSQSRRHSAIEASANVFSGMIISFTISFLAHYYQSTIQYYIWKNFVWDISITSNIAVTCVLTVVSIVRGYIWTRHFNRRAYNETTKK